MNNDNSLQLNQKAEVKIFFAAHIPHGISPITTSFIWPRQFQSDFLEKVPCDRGLEFLTLLPCDTLKDFLLWSLLLQLPEGRGLS